MSLDCPKTVSRLDFLEGSVQIALNVFVYWFVKKKVSKSAGFLFSYSLEGSTLIAFYFLNIVYWFIFIIKKGKANELVFH